MLISSEVHGPPCCPGSNGTDITWHIKVTFMKSCSNIIQEHQLKNEASYVKGLNIYLKKHTSVWFYCLQGWQRIDNNWWRHLGSMYFVPKRKNRYKRQWTVSDKDTIEIQNCLQIDDTYHFFTTIENSIPASTLAWCCLFPRIYNRKIFCNANKPN